MSNPQQPELARSRRTPSQDQDAVAAVVEGQRFPGANEPGGPVPLGNQPGHHPPEEQDKPDLNAFAEKLGVETSEADDERSETPEPTVQVAGREVPRVAALAAVVLAVLLAVIAGRRIRSRGSR